MTAIWPAGPPKLSAATRSQTRNASAMDGSGVPPARELPWRATNASVISGPRLLGMPGVGLVRRVAAPAIERVVERHARPRAGQGRRHTCATGRATRRAARPLAALRSMRPVSAPRTMAARRSSGSVLRPNSSTMTSKVQRSPRWLQTTPSTSNGVAPNRSATPSTSAGATNRNTALGSTKRRISQGQAMRSTFGRERVTQTVRPARIERRHFGRGHQRQSGFAPALAKPSSSASAGTPACRSHAAAPSLSLAPFWQMTTAERPANSPAHAGRIAHADGGLRSGISRGSALKSSSVRTSIRTGQCGRADQARELIDGNGVDRGHAASLH